MCYAGRQDPEAGEGHQHAAGPAVAGRSSDDQWGTRPSPIKGGGHSTPSSSYLDAPRVSLPVVFSSYKSIHTSASRSLQVLKTLPLISLQKNVQVHTPPAPLPPRRHRPNAGVPLARAPRAGEQQRQVPHRRVQHERRGRHHPGVHRRRRAEVDVRGRPGQALRQDQVPRRHGRQERRWHEAPDLGLQHQWKCEPAVLLHG